MGRQSVVDSRVVLLAGGTGGAKLACGLRDLIGDRLTVVANTGDDIEIYGVHVSPDPDLIAYRLAGVLGEDGHGISGDSHNTMAGRRAQGEDVWFTLGDRDMAICRRRAELMADGKAQTAAHAEALAEFDLGGAEVLPMSDDPVRTCVLTAGGRRTLQEFLVRDRCHGEITGVEFLGADRADPSPAVATAIERADLIVIGPSNPVISIGPILEMCGMRSIIGSARAPVVAVSPLVGGVAVKGPTERFLAASGIAIDTAGVAAIYSGIADAVIADRPSLGTADDEGREPAVIIGEVGMPDAAAARDLAQRVIETGRLLLGAR